MAKTRTKTKAKPKYNSVEDLIIKHLGKPTPIDPRAMAKKIVMPMEMLDKEQQGAVRPLWPATFRESLPFEATVEGPNGLKVQLNINLKHPEVTPITALFILSAEQVEALLKGGAKNPPSLTRKQRALFEVAAILPRVQPSWGYVVSPERLGDLVQPPEASWPLLT